MQLKDIGLTNGSNEKVIIKRLNGINNTFSFHDYISNSLDILIIIHSLKDFNVFYTKDN